MFQESSVGAGATSDFEVQPLPLHLRRKSPMNCIGEALLEFCFAGVCCWKWVMADAMSCESLSPVRRDRVDFLERSNGMSGLKIRQLSWRNRSRSHRRRSRCCQKGCWGWKIIVIHHSSNESPPCFLDIEIFISIGTLPARSKFCFTESHSHCSS